jgi:hypothetical protein
MKYTPLGRLSRDNETVCPEIFFTCFKTCPYELQIVRVAFLRLPIVCIVVEEMKGLGNIEKIFSLELSTIPKMVCPD